VRPIRSNWQLFEPDPLRSDASGRGGTVMEQLRRSPPSPSPSCADLGRPAGLPGREAWRRPGCRSAEPLPGRPGPADRLSAETGTGWSGRCPGLDQEPWPASHTHRRELARHGGQAARARGPQPGRELLGLALRDGRRALLGALALTLPPPPPRAAERAGARGVAGRPSGRCRPCSWSAGPGERLELSSRRWTSSSR